MSKPPDVSPEEAALNFLDFVGNKERALGAAALVMAAPQSTFSTSSVREALNYGDQEPVWPITRSGTTGVINCLVAAGMAERIESRKQTQFYQLREGPHQPMLRALVRFGIKWSLDYPGLSLQQVLGSTQTNGGVRSPRARYKIYGHLLHNADQSMSQICGKYDEVGYKTANSLKIQMERLSELGLVSVEVDNEYDPLLEVIKLPHAPNILPDTRLLRELTATFPPGTTLRLKTLWKLLEERHPEQSFRHLRSVMVALLHDKGLFGGLVIKEESNGQTGLTARVELAPGVEGPIRSLHHTIQRIIKGDFKTPLKRTNRSISPATLGTLLAKGKRFSTSYEGKVQRHETEPQIMSVMKGTGAFTLEDIRQALFSDHGRHFSADGLQDRLDRLVDKGDIRVTQQRHGKSGHHSNARLYTRSQLRPDAKEQ